MLVCSVLKISRLVSESKFQMLTLFSSRHITTDVHQHGVSILGFVNFYETFRRISEVWENAQG